MIKRIASILIVAAGVCQSLEARQPNIILIMADDLGYETIGANGGDSYATPNLDRLAAGGMRFERCSVQPLCTPTRVQLMTGMYNVRNYIKFGLIDPDSTTFAHLLKNGGYATGVAGKWQLGADKDLPQKLGFDESCLWQHTRRPPRYANPGLEYNGEERDFSDGEYGPDLVNDFAIDFVTRHKAGPFFLYYPMMLTHVPYQPTPDSADWDPTATGEKDGKDPKHFGDMVAYMDKLIGKLVTKLNELGIRDNTLVLFLGDNGTGVGVTSLLDGQPYPGGKGSTTARGMHVPLIANWPARVSGRRVNSDLIDSTDFLPTLCEAAGVELPESLTIDGQSFLPQLLDEKGKPREWIYCWCARDGGPKARFEFAMNKELKVYRDGRIFDLKADPFEEHPLDSANLSAEQVAAAKVLAAAMDQYASARPEHLLVSNGEVAKKKTPKDPAKRAARMQRRQAAQSPSE